LYLVFINLITSLVHIFLCYFCSAFECIELLGQVTKNNDL
jgi:hypothetical protein